MKQVLKWLLLIGIVFSMTACGSNTKNEVNAVVQPVNTTDEVTIDLTADAETPSDDASETYVDLVDGVLNPLTGEIVSGSSLATRPLAIMFDNQYSARPQAGLIEADVAYEMLAEGLITRYMGIFYSRMPEHVGPIRSSRPYFLVKALEFNPFYVHVGGSMQALSDIKTYKMADVDGLTSGAFHRESHKKIPHNMYSEASTLIVDGLKRGYKDTVDVTFLDFKSTFELLPEGLDAQKISFTYKAPTSSDKVGYATSYLYDDEAQRYMRYTNSSPHVDEDTGEQLYATNILVQYVSQKVLDSEGRLALGLVGEGEGMYYTGGKGIAVTWKKADAYSLTKFYDENGDAILLNPGKTWFQIMPHGNKETIDAL